MNRSVQQAESIKGPDTKQAEPLEKSYRRLPGFLGYLSIGLALAFVFFHLATGLMGRLPAMQQRIIHVTLGWMMIWLLMPAHDRLRENKKALIIDLVFMVVTLVIGLYVYSSFNTYAERVGLGVPLRDIFLGTIAILFTIELARRTIGPVFVFILVGFLLFAYFGPFLPALIAHRGMDIPKIVGSFFLNTSGIYGMITGVSATYIALFIILAAVIRESGVGDFFINVSLALFGTVRGGAAKMAILTSSFFGIITGSSIANVAGTGSFTIPLMKRSGYPSHFAAAVEAVSSSGAQLVPPIMGGSVFIMIEILGMSYWEVAKSALLVAILFYIALFFMVDYEALKNGLAGIPREQLPKLKDTLINQGHLLVPIILLIYLLAIADLSPPRAAALTIISIPIISLFRKSTWMGPRKIYGALKQGAYGSLIIVGVVCAASLIQGIVDRTALGFNLSTILIQASQGHLLVLLFFTMIASLIIGMGLPVMICYILLAVLVAPALVDLGVAPLAAHLFIFYFGILSNITPPVAPDAFVAASIAGSPMLKTAVTATKIGLVLYLIPYMMVFNPVLTLKGDMITLLWTFGSAAVGTYMLASCLQGIVLYDWRIKGPLRFLMLIGALTLIKPGKYTDLIGGALLITVILLAYMLRKTKTRTESI